MDAVSYRSVAVTLAILLAAHGSVAESSRRDLYLTPPHKSHTVELFINDSYVVTCHSTSGEQMTWVGPDKGRIYDKGRVHVEAGKQTLTLVFTAIEKKDKGKYTCSSRIGGQEVSVFFKLIVFTPIQFVDTPAVQEVKENASGLVRCEVQGDPEPKIKWEINNTSIEESSNYSIGGDGLVIKRVSLEDRGFYQCQAYQLSDQVTKMESQTILLKVLHGPKENNETEKAYGFINGTKNLTCDAVSEPLPTFRWLKNNVTITGDDNMVIFNENYTSTLMLTIHNASFFGEYTCLASNKYGAREKIIQLEEGNKPAAPTFSIKAHTDDTIELEITAPNGGELKILKYRIEYVRHQEGSSLNWDAAEAVEIEVPPFKIEGLTQDTKYSLRVAAINAAGLSDYTNIQSVTTASRESQQNTASSGFRIHFMNVPSYLLTACFAFETILPLLKGMYIL